MAEYVERKTAIDAVTGVYYNTPDINLTAEKLEDAINGIPAVDVAPVVRCKDCASGMVEDGHKYVTCCSHGIRMDFEDFCSYGARREDQ